MAKGPGAAAAIFLGLRTGRGQPAPSLSTAADLNQRGLSQRPWANGTPRRWYGGAGLLAVWSGTALFSRPLLH